MIYHTFIFLFIISYATATQNINIEFQVRKKHPNWDASIVLGKLTLNLILQHRTIEAYITPYHKQLIQSSDFEDSSPLIIEFAAIKSSHPDYINKNYLTSVDEFAAVQHGQKITLVAGFAQARFHINSINYVQTRNRVQQIFTQVVYTDQQYHQIFKYNQVQKKNAIEDQSFFSKYKWPLIIGGVILYTMLTVDPKAAEGAAPRQ